MQRRREGGSEFGTHGGESKAGLREAGGGGLLFRFASSVALLGGRGSCFPRLRCSGSWLLYMERALRCVQFLPSGVPQKRRLGYACILCLPRPEQLRQPGA
ncbi:unnamed protein product [Rangifer tarandus platyrhynchus]|uniref:Uncharacterized protein n=1 Tax=Rangifer tarandus platyrhynchus TaxID=3082113 RepID=A0AC59ZNS8_RANTA